ncbi:MAG: hypothetical protein PHI31_04785 [Desulfuromonadaceae bacterium]|nr:hypothetical protein [Desulfuromonadaceae bacterium]
MKIFVDAIVASFEMLGMFFCAFVVIFLLAIILYPLENKLSEMVWKHSDVKIPKNVHNSSFREFSHKHR